MSTMKWDESFFDRLGTSSQVDAIVGGVAEDAAAIARANAPVDTGAYRDSIRVTKRRSGHRSVFVVTAADPKGMLIESKHGVLVRAMQQAAARA